MNSKNAFQRKQRKAQNGRTADFQAGRSKHAKRAARMSKEPKKGRVAVDLESVRQENR